MPPKRLRLIVVDDSPFILNSFRHILKDHAELELTAVFTSGREAIAWLRDNPADVVLLDLTMPEMDGVETTRHIMENKPTPIIIFSAADRMDPNVVRCLSLGAVDMIQKPGGKERSVGLKEICDELVEKVAQAAKSNLRALAVAPRTAPPRRKAPKRGHFNAILIGVSTGGPSTLIRIFSALPPAYRHPILVVQHISDGYSASLAENLQSKCALPVREAVPMESIEPGRIYIAKTGVHLEISPTQKIRLHHGEPMNGFMPSADALFMSAAKNFKGRALGIVLTGMGNDGCAGCKALQAAGHYVVIQDQATSVVWGMPGEVHRAGAFDEMLSLDEISETLCGL